MPTTKLRNRTKYYAQKLSVRTNITSNKAFITTDEYCTHLRASKINTII